MTDRELEARLGAFYRADVGEGETAPLALRGHVAAIPRAIPGPARWFGRGRGITLLAAAALLLVGGVVAAGSGLVRLPSVVPPEPVPSLAADATPTAATSPAPTETTSPVPARAAAWIATATMGTPRSGLAAVRLLDGRVLVVGGADEDDTSAELYDPDSGTWSATGNMVKSHAGLAAALLRDGRVLVFGEDANPEVYDPESGTWTATRKMVWGDGETATQLRDGTVLVRGDGGSELYDPDSGTWTATRSKSAQRHSHAAILLPDGKVLVAGGHVAIDNPTDSAELYDPDTGSWTAIADMHAQREVIEAFLQPDGKVLVVGGSNQGDPQSVELYDPASGAWTAIGDVSRGGKGEITMLADGRVLLARGANRNDAELYDPSTGSWTTTAPMLRSHGSAILLLDGTVLAAGGSDCLDGVCVPTGAAELYVPVGVSPPPLPAFPSPPPPAFPSPTPTPTPVPPAVGPVPPSARPWTVSVVNKSSQPTTLFVAEDGAGGMGRLVGRVTPNVVAPRATVRVTFLLPAKGSRGWSIFVNPADTGPLLLWSDVPLAGEIRVTEYGQVGWLSP